MCDGYLEIHWFDGEQVPSEIECDPTEEKKECEEERDIDTDGNSSESEDEEDNTAAFL